MLRASVFRPRWVYGPIFRAPEWRGYNLFLGRGFASYPSHRNLQFPALSPTMTKGNLAKWYKKEGDQVNQGEVIADVETDKATVQWEAMDEGYVGKLLVPEGTTDVPLGKDMLVLVESKDDVAAFKDYSPDSEKKSEDKPKEKPQEKEKEKRQETEKETEKPRQEKEPEEPKKEPKEKEPKEKEPKEKEPKEKEPKEKEKSGDRVIASPYAKKLAAEKNIDLRQVTGTGPSKRIVAADISEFKGQPAAEKEKSKDKAAPSSRAQTAEYTDVPHTSMRKAIARRLLQSKQEIPHYYLSVEINMDKVLKLRADINTKLAAKGDKGDKKADSKISVNDFIVKAAALSLREVPALNSSWLDNATRQYKYVDISVAVSTDSGLITPIVKDADQKGLSAIAREVRELAVKARDKKLKPEEFEGGTFTISNLGMFGVTNFSAIINPPQAAILAVGTTVKKVVANENRKEGQADSAQYKVSQVMSVTLSCDHRVVDGAVGAQWLQHFKNLLEDPLNMLL